MLKAIKLEPCYAPLWAPKGHGQTILSFCLPDSPVTLASVPETLTLPDGDQLVLLYNAGASDYVVYLFHGLTGHASVSYMQRVATLCIQAGHSVYRVNHRDCGEGEGLARQPYHSGRGEDISEVIALGRRKHPDKQHIVIGFSLSGNALLTLLTGLRGTVLPDYAISVNAPIDLAASLVKLQTGFNKLYDIHFARGLRRVIDSKYQRGLLTHKLQKSCLRNVNDIDIFYTAPAGGFLSANDYYQTCSTAQHLHKVNVPTVLLTSRDDPFVPHEMYLKATLSKDVHLHIEPVGGHMGYLSRRKTPLGNHRWLDYALSSYLKCFTSKGR